jgi:holo-[acyl-carrier protein] synthase
MEKIAIGIDIIEISRIKQAIGRWKSRFLNRIYTDREISLYGEKIESLAARFAAKEAVMKALSSIESGNNWQEIEILSDKCGKPYINLSGHALDRMRQLGITGFELSLSHSRENAIALVIGTGER